MAGPFVPYVINDGEYLEQVALRLGFDSDAVWNHEKNRQIRELRNGKSHLLCAGDLVFVPKPSKAGLPLNKGTANRFVAKVPSTTMELHFEGVDGPLANEAYTFTIEGVEQQGTTDGGGKATFTLPITCTQVHVVFPNKDFELTAKVGHLDPIEEPSGVRQRLKRRGYITGEPSADESAEAATLERAIRAFQQDQNLPVTGQMDDATTARLREISKS